MRLLKRSPGSAISLTEDMPGNFPAYAILSHTWGQQEDEVTFNDVEMGNANTRSRGYAKVQFCAKQAERDSLQYFWIDTCCINKNSHVELSEAITSMFRWYNNATRCYVFLSDVSATNVYNDDTKQEWKAAFSCSRWFRRGWTLQELLAPASVGFFSREGTYLGSKKTLEKLINKITNIPISALRGEALSSFTVDERLGWTTGRNTTKLEDKAYCLLGVFGVFMPLMYGEGENAFQRLRDEISRQSATQYSTMRSIYSDLSQIEVDCLRCLYITDYASHRDSNSIRAEGTCEWLLQHNKYSHWLRQRSSFLWISADAGRGKSVMSAFLVDHFESKHTQTNANEVICYFFFKDDNEIQRSASSAICALLHQLFVANKHLVKYAIPDFVSKQSAFTKEFSTLWRIFLTATTKSKNLSTICILDGLDQCEQTTRMQLMRSLVELFSNPLLNETTQSCLKIVVTSRFHPTIESGLYALRNLRMKVEDEAGATKEDIKRVVRMRLHRISSIRVLSDSLRQNLEIRLTENADQTFLWVISLLDRIEKSAMISTEAVENAVLEIPPYYGNVLAASFDAAGAQRIIRILRTAVRPFSVNEANVALSIDSHTKNYDQLDLASEVSDTIKDICGGLVEIRDSNVHVVQQAASASVSNEYPVISQESLETPSGTFDSSHFELYHNELTRICVTYLLLDNFKQRLPLETGQFVTERNRTIIDDYVANYCFLEYAARCWNVHLKQSNITPEHPLWEWILRLSDPSGMQFATWFSIYWRYERPYYECAQMLDTLSVASFFGHESICRWNLERGSQVDKVGNESRMAIHWAAENGHTEVVKLLLHHGSSLERTCKWYGTPLMLAAKNGHDSLVRLLLQYGASVDHSDLWGMTPLQCASEQAQLVVVHTLLQAGANCNSKYRGGRTPLHWAASSNYSADHGSAIEVIRSLLLAGACVNSMADHGWTPLHCAATSTGAETAECVRILIEAGADVNARTTDGQTALDFALKSWSQGAFAIVEVLQSRGGVRSSTLDETASI